jgi:hypothetical protein
MIWDGRKWSRGFESGMDINEDYVLMRNIGLSID